MDGFQGNGRMPIYESFRIQYYCETEHKTNGKKMFLNRGIFIFTKKF